MKRELSLPPLLITLISLISMMARAPLPAQIEPPPTVTSSSPVNYQIEAQLFPDEKKLLGYETINWMNTSNKEVDILRFHLYYNAFKNENTLFMREAGYGNRPQTDLSGFTFGGIDIKEFRIWEGEELTSKIRYVAAGDEGTPDRTVMEVRLRNPVPPGQVLTLKISFVLFIPQIFSDTGQAGEYFFLARWFPQIGVLLPDGNWNCPQHHYLSIPFSNFGSYRVGITLPERFMVGATGNLIKKTKNADGTYTHVFEEHRIQDFAWTAYSAFTEIIEKIRLKHSPHETTIVFLLSHPRGRVIDRYRQALRHAMEYYAERIFPYPYRKITLVDPPQGGLRSGGRSYPTLITGRHIEALPSSLKFTELVTIREFGRQYWSGLIAPDTLEEPWLPEGINTFFEMEISDGLFDDGSPLIDTPLIKIRNWQIHRWKYRALPPVDRISQNIRNFTSRISYSGMVRSKTGLLLRSLKNYLGKQKTTDFFKSFAERYRFRHPEGTDFIKHLNQFTAEDFSWIFKYFMDGNDHLDHAVEAIRSVPTNTGAETYRNEAVFVRYRGYFPVELSILHENGKQVKYFWREEGNRKIIRYEDPSPIRSASIDPEFKIPLDINRLNNHRDRSPNRNTTARTTLKLGYVFQNILGFLFL